jgi:glucose-1-phosphate cytidylyltransferase
MVFKPAFFDCVEGDDTVLEKDPMTALIAGNQLMAYTHKGYWQCMDTLREKEKLEKLWNSGNAPWKIWKD